jgi:ribonuclease E
VARPEAEATSPGGEAGTAPKRRRRRGGRGRGRGRAAATSEATTTGPTTEPDDQASTGETTATQRDDAAPDADGDTPTTSAGSRRRRRSRGSRASKAPADRQAPEKQPAKAAASKTTTLEERIAAGGPTRGIRSSRTRTGGDRRRRREPLAPPPRESDKLMVITENGERDQIAVLENDVLVQHYVTRQGATSMVGNVYLGRVQNVLPGMEAAFVDVGRGRNGVLYAGEVNYSLEDVEGPAPRIEQVLKPGQSVIVQVSKDPMGGKGARLTANISLAGRYLVLAPDQDLSGISRRLSEDVRKRLKSILKKVKPDQHGVIVRTAAEGATDEQIRDDLERLLREWSEIEHRAKRSKAPAVLYEEPELTVRVVRDLFTDEEFRGLVTDSRRVFDKVMGYVQEIAPDLADKIHLHEGKLPAFEEHRVVEQIQKALERKVWLPSGGYLFIERTEAMTIVDVNTGKSVGKTNLEETVLNTNLEAAREVARQLRLRDIGGIIVIDFIDMLLEKNRGKVEDAMREALAVDKTRSQVFEIGPLGLMQVTRKRVSSGLVESFSETCPTCEGRGILTTYQID